MGTRQVIFFRNQHKSGTWAIKLAPAGIGTVVVGLLAGFLLWTTNADAGNRPEKWRNYELLLDFIRMDDRQDPLVEFTRTGKAVDSALSRENRRFISENKTLLENIRTELNSERPNWQLMATTKHLMVVPETHPEYAALFESYCRLAVDYVLQETRLPNPYQAITTLAGPPPDPIAPGDEGITAYLVHNIADVYSEEYVFFDDLNAEHKIKIKLDNRVYLGEIGSYSSYLVIEGDNDYTFERNPYTLWRNSAENPLNVFIAPIEETLHIALRSATESAIKARLDEHPPATRTDIDAVVEEWLAVEEAVVGGLVSALLPAIVDGLRMDSESIDMAQTLSERHAFAKYRFLDRGIDIVNQLGLASVIRIYREEPRQFKTWLTHPALELPAAASGQTTETDGSKPAA